MTTTVDAAEVGKTYDCREPNCTEAARSDRGPYSRCDYHRQQHAASATDRQHPRPNTPATPNGNGFVGQLDGLKALAKSVDRAKAHAADLTRRALAAKREAEALEAKLRAAVRDLSA